MDNLSSPTNTSNNTQQVVSETKLALYGVLLVLSLFGNVLVIAVVFYNEHLRTNFNYLIVNMAISDLFIPLLAIPVQISDEAGLEWMVSGAFGEALCKLYSFLTDISPAVSSFSLVIMAAHRFVSIGFPFKIGLLNILKKKKKFLIALTWLMATALLAPYFHIVNLYDKNGLTNCVFNVNEFESKTSQMVYTAFYIFGTFFVPFIIITILYSIMLYKLYTRSRAVEEMFDDKQLKSRQRRNDKIFRLSMVIILTYALCWGPLFCFLLVKRLIFSPDKTSPDNEDLIMFIIWYIAYASTAINPCIYFIFIKRFRVGLRRLLRREKASAVRTHPQRDNRLKVCSTDLRMRNANGCDELIVKETVV